MREGRRTASRGEPRTHPRPSESPAPTRGQGGPQHTPAARAEPGTHHCSQAARASVHGVATVASAPDGIGRAALYFHDLLRQPITPPYHEKSRRRPRNFRGHEREGASETLSQPKGAQGGNSVVSGRDPGKGGGHQGTVKENGASWGLRLIRASCSFLPVTSAPE